MTRPYDNPKYVVYRDCRVVCEIYGPLDPRNWGERFFTLDLLSCGIMRLTQTIEHYIDVNKKNEITYIFVLKGESNEY